MRTYATIALALLLGTLSFSQECNNTFKGKIIDLHDDTPLVGATIIIAGLETALVSDVNGEFTFKDLCNNTYSFQVSHPYCATKGFTFKIEGNTNKTLKLEHHLEELNQVILQGNAHRSNVQTTNEQVLKNSEIETFSNQTFGDALKSLSGVSTLNTGNTVVKPVINGLHSSRVLIINNGVRLEDQEWGAEHAPNIDINSSGNISVIKGASALEFGGDAIGGVIISESSKIPVKDTLYGKTISTIASNGRGGTISSQLTKSYNSGWHTSLQGSLKRFGDFEAPHYVLSNTGIFERNFSVKTGYNNFDSGFEAYYSLFKNDIGILRASHLGGAQDQVNAINSNEPLIINDFTYNINEPRQEVTHHLGRLKAFKKFKDIGKLTVQYDYQFNKRLEFDVRRGDDRDKASLDLDLKTHTLKLDLKGKINTNGKFSTGIIGRYKTNFANPNTGVRRLIPDYDAYHFGAYATANYNINSNWIIETGLRFDHNFIDALKFYRLSFWESRGYNLIFQDLVVNTEGNQVLVNPKFNFSNFSASFGTKHNFNNNYSISLNYALASRAPNPSELFSEGLHHSASRIEYGDLRFTSEISNKVSLNLNKTGNKFSFNVNPFINYINNFILIEPTGVQQTIRGNFQIWEYRQTNAKLLGLDIDAIYSLTNNLNYKHQLSFVKGYDVTKDNPLINMPPVNTQNSIIYNNKKINNLKLEIQSDYVFRQNEFPNTNFEVFIPETQTTELVDVSTPPKAYHLINFKSGIDFKIGKNTNSNVGLNITNIFNTNYRDYLNRQRFYANNIGRNFIIHLKLNY